MDRLRPRERDRSLISGFSRHELKRLEDLHTEYGDFSVNRDFCVKVAKSFNRSAGRAGKPIVKWAEVQNWFQDRLKSNPVKATPPATNQKNATRDDPKILAELTDGSCLNKANGTCEIPEASRKVRDLSELEFEARSSRDGAWYDVDRFTTHRFSSSGEAEVRVRFVGFGADEDEWVNVKTDVRERSVPLENWECEKVKVGDVMLCLQEKKDQAIYYDAHVVDIVRRMHDIRGCRCIFSVQYDHDKSEEKVRLRRLCRVLCHIYTRDHSMTPGESQVLLEGVQPRSQVES